MHHGVSFNFGSAKVCSPAIFETTYKYMDCCNFYMMCLFSIDSNSPINKFLQLNNFEFTD